MKLFKQSLRINLHGLGSGKGFLDEKGAGDKRKDKMDFKKKISWNSNLKMAVLQELCKMKKTTEWEKYLQIMYLEGSRYPEELERRNIKKKKFPN